MADLSNMQQIEPRSWIFQANPNIYRIEESLAVERLELWNLRQHVKQIKKGDTVFIWISGTNAGIYAIGTVISEPEMRMDSEVGKSYWTSSRDGSRIYPRVWIRYDRVLLDHPLYRDFLKCDPILDSLQVIQSPRGTNFSVTENQRKALDIWLH